MGVPKALSIGLAPLPPDTSMPHPRHVPGKVLSSTCLHRKGGEATQAPDRDVQRGITPNWDPLPHFWTWRVHAEVGQRSRVRSGVPLLELRGCGAGSTESMHT